VLGTNPIAFAAPARRNPPFLLDIATSTVAGNKVKVYDLNNKPLPPGWMIDENGKPIRDAALAMDYIHKRDVGGMTPLGGTPEMGSHKGYGLSVMAHILGGTLAGGAFSPIRNRTQRKGAPDNIGHFFLALDPKAFREDGGFEDDLDAVIDELHRVQPSDAALPVLVAGEPEAFTQEVRVREGIPMPQTLVDKIRAVCERSGVSFVLE
jgi:LDH2 family malate/lactate/ureidoglycolate dehydrogenase